MDITMLINMLDAASEAAEAAEKAGDYCGDLAPVLRIVGWGIFFIKIAVPLILIIVGMIEMAKAVASGKDDEVKTAQKKLVQKAIGAVIVFVIATIVGLLMTLVGGNNYKECTTCINKPWDPVNCPAETGV